MEKIKIIVLSSQEGDWEGVYVSGELEAEDHSLNNKKFWWDLGKTYGSDGVLSFHELQDEDEKELQEVGNLPEHISELKCQYE